MNILSISRFVPYDVVPHAGGKIHNYNIKRLNREKNFNVRLLTFCEKYDLDKLDHEKYNLEMEVIYLGREFWKNWINNYLKNKTKYLPFHKYGNFGEEYIKRSIISVLNKYKNEGYKPDIIILEWTQIVFFAPLIKKIFKEAKIIAIEHDVTFQSYERKMRNKKSILKKFIYKIRTKQLKSSELKALKICDEIIVFNEKDKKMLIENNIESKKVITISPYYQDISDINPMFKSKNLLFYGKMDREENFLSCIWFIENVFNKLIKYHPDIKFYIVGYNPPKELLKYKSENIIITGFVDNPKQYFEKSVCLIAPLLLGAGIKIKILEAMSSGIVVLTNDIGIEGIPVKDNEHYIHCTTADDYSEKLNKIFSGEIDLNYISSNAQAFLKDKFSVENGYENFKESLIKIYSNNL